MTDIRLLILMISFPLLAYAVPHSSVVGSVRDAATKEPLAYTNVFLANTTIGDAADTNGKFILEKVPFGSYQLVISHISYEMVVMDVAILPGKAKTFDIEMNAKRLEGEEITVVAEKNKRTWQRDLREFSLNFIGNTDNAAKCRIVNPEVLSFEREAGTQNLLASSDHLLVIENRSLGYRLDIVLHSFRWGRHGGQYIIYPKYVELEPENEREHQGWLKNRAETFRLSMRDFFASLAAGDQASDYKIFLVDENVSTPASAPISPDSLFIVTLDSTWGFKRLRQNENFQIENKRQGSSRLNLKYHYIDFDQWGNIYPANGVSVSGFWGQFRVADSLPFDYRPDE